MVSNPTEHLFSRSVSVSIYVTRTVSVSVLFLLYLTACASNRSHTEPPPPEPPSDPGAIEATIFLVGDAGEPRPDMASVLETLAEDAKGAPPDAPDPVIVFLGDNVYERGFPPDSDSSKFREAAERIDPQLAAVSESGATGIFIAGNHDWDNKGQRGWGAVRIQADYVERSGSLMRPQNGCPGPSVHEVGERVSLVILDTQWWLHENTKPGGVSTSSHECPHKDESEILSSIRSTLAQSTAAGRDVVVAGHHPLISGGRHGGYWTVADHFFLPGKLKWLHTIPAIVAAGVGIATGEEWLFGVAAAVQMLPPLGHIYGRKWVTSKRQDLSDAWYRSLRDSLRAAFEDNPPLVFAGGHDHNLQVHAGTVEGYNLVSGAGSPSKLTAAKALDTTYCKEVKPGYMRLDFLRGQQKQVLLTLVAAEEGGRSFRETCRMFLKGTP